jgi:hypothetical protein
VSLACYKRVTSTAISSASTFPVTAITEVLQKCYRSVTSTAMSSASTFPVTAITGTPTPIFRSDLKVLQDGRGTVFKGACSSSRRSVTEVLQKCYRVARVWKECYKGVTEVLNK